MFFTAVAVTAQWWVENVTQQMTREHSALKYFMCSSSHG